MQMSACVRTGEPGAGKLGGSAILLPTLLLSVEEDDGEVLCGVTAAKGVFLSSKNAAKSTTKRARTI